MRYYYVPSTYRGRKFGSGFDVVNFRGCGRICGGSLVDLSTPSVAMPVEIPIQPAQIEENLVAIPDITDEMIERAQKIVAYAEATGRAKPITKKEASLWSGIKNLGSKAWDATKNAAVTVANNPVVQTAVKYGLPIAVNAVMPAASSYVTGAIANALAPKKEEPKKPDSLFHQSLWLEMMAHPERFTRKPPESTGLLSRFKKWWSGGAYRAGAYRAGAYRAGAYRGGRKLKKGSLEAKLYMAKLRAMRGNSKKKSGKKGGMFRGVTRADIQALLDKDEYSPTITVNWVDKNGETHATVVKREKAENMINATNDLINYYKYKNKNKKGEWSNERTPEEIAAFRKENREAEGRKSWKQDGGLYKRWGAKRNRILMRQLEKITGEDKQKKWDDMKAYWEQRADPALLDYIFATKERKKELEPKLRYKIRKDLVTPINDMTKLLEQRMKELNINAANLENAADAVAVAQDAADIAQAAAADAPDTVVPVVQAAADAAALNAQQAQQAVTTQQAIKHAQAAVDNANTVVNITNKVGGKKKKHKKKKAKSFLKASLEAEKRAKKKLIKSSPINDDDDDDPLADIGLG